MAAALAVPPAPTSPVNAGQDFIQFDSFTCFIPLPHNPFQDFDEQTRLAYERCTKAEQHAEQYRPKFKLDLNKFNLDYSRFWDYNFYTTCATYARVAGYMIIELHRSRARIGTEFLHRLCREICSPDNITETYTKDAHAYPYASIYQVGEYYTHHLLWACE